METVEIKIYEDVLNRSMNYKCRCESYNLAVYERAIRWKYELRALFAEWCFDALHYVKIL